MRKEEILRQSSMPAASPSYPRGPYRFLDREYLIVQYESDPKAIAETIPEPLEPDGSNSVMYEFIKMPDSAGFGSYEESGMLIPARFRGESVNFVAQMYLDCHPAIVGGREIWGFPKKLGNPKLSIQHDTLTGKLEYAGVTVAVATMAYKHENIICPDKGKEQDCDSRVITDKLQKTNVNLKIIPDVDGSLQTAQLVAYNMEDIHIRWAWEGPARLALFPHVNAPVADLPVNKVNKGMHLIGDMTLPYGRVLYDYLKE